MKTFPEEAMNKKVRLTYEISDKREELVGQVVNADDEFIRFVTENDGRDMLIARVTIREIWNL